MRDRTYNAALLAVLVLGGALRFSGLGIQSLWLDEFSSWQVAGQDRLSAVIAATRHDVHPPGYYLLLHLVIAWFGDSESGLRLLSAAAGTASIAAIAHVGRLLYSRLEGLLAAMLLAVSWSPLYYSQEARSYSLLLLLGLLSVSAFLGVAQGDASRRRRVMRIAWFVGVAAAMAYTHYFGLMFVGLLMLVGWTGIVPSLRTRRQLLLAGGLALLLFAPWIPALLAQSSSYPDFWIEAPTPGIVPEFGRFLFSRSDPLVAFALIVGAISLRARVLDRRAGAPEASHRNRAAGFLWFWLLAPLVAAYLYSETVRPILTKRNLIVSVPAAYLLLARGITTLPLRRPGQAVVAAVFLALTIYQVFGARAYYSEPRKQQWREAARYVVQEEPESARPLILCTVDSPGFDYYFERLGSAWRVDLVVARSGDLPAVSRRLAENPTAAVWLLGVQEEPPAGLLPLLRGHGHLVREASLVGCTARRFDVD